MTSRKNMSRVAAVSVAMALSFGATPYALAQEDTSTPASTSTEETGTSDKEVVDEPGNLRVVYPDISTVRPGEEFSIEPIELIKKGIEGKEDNVVVKLGDDAPEWVMLDSNTGVISGTAPTDLSDGEIRIPVIMNNTADESTPAARFFGVLNVVSKDSVYPEPASVKAGEAFTIAPGEETAKMIAEGDTFSITDESLAEWVNIDPNTGVISGTIPADFEGNTLSIPVLFKHGDEETVAKAVVNVSKVSPISEESVAATDPYYPEAAQAAPGSPFMITASDKIKEQGLTPELAEGTPEWVSLTDEGNLMGTVPVDAKLGDHKFVVLLKDKDGKTTQSMATLTVVEPTAVATTPVSSGSNSASRPTLASTGANVGILAGLAGALVLAGAGALVVARRKGAFNRN